MNDPGAKCLVFSMVNEAFLLRRTVVCRDIELGCDLDCFLVSCEQWQSVLDIIAKALLDNNLEFSQINGIHKFQV